MLQSVQIVSFLCKKENNIFFLSFFASNYITNFWKETLQTKNSGYLFKRTVWEWTAGR